MILRRPAEASQECSDVGTNPVDPCHRMLESGQNQQPSGEAAAKTALRENQSFNLTYAFLGLRE